MVADIRSVIGSYELQKNRHGIKNAIVAPEDLGYGLMRMFDTLAEKTVPQDRKICGSLEEAIHWLTID